MKPLFWLLSLIPFLCACQSRDLNFSIRFRDVDGLQAGDRVFLAGREAGKVKAIQSAADGIQVAVKIREPFRHQVTSGSRYTIETDPTAPDRQSVQVTPDPKCQPLAEGAVVEGTEPVSGLFGPLLKGFGENLKTLQREFQSLTQELEKLPRSPQFRDLERRLQELARQMREAEKKLQQDVLPQLQQEMERLRQELEQLEKAKSREMPPSGSEAIDL